MSDKSERRKRIRREKRRQRRKERSFKRIVRTIFGWLLSVLIAIVLGWNGILLFSDCVCGWGLDESGVHKSR